MGSTAASAEQGALGGPGDVSELRHPLESFVPDPAGCEPLCAEPAFAAILDEMVAGAAPRLFAVVQEFGERVNARIAAWGMEFADSAKIFSVDGRTSMDLSAPEDALRGFRVGSRIRARLVWCEPPADRAEGDLL